MPDYYQDPIDREANTVTELLRQGDHASAAARLQDSATRYRPQQFTALVAQVEGRSKSEHTISHLEITPIVSATGRDDRLNVTLITPALDNRGRQYVDGDGRPMAYIDQIAQIQNSARTQVVELCRPPVRRDPSYVDRPWLRDHGRDRVTFGARVDDNGSSFRLGVNLGGLDLGFRIDGGRDYERRPDHRRYEPPYDRRYEDWRDRPYQRWDPLPGRNHDRSHDHDRNRDYDRNRDHDRNRGSGGNGGNGGNRGEISNGGNRGNGHDVVVNNSGNNNDTTIIINNPPASSRDRNQDRARFSSSDNARERERQQTSHGRAHQEQEARRKK